MKNLYLKIFMISLASLVCYFKINAQIKKSLPVIICGYADGTETGKDSLQLFIQNEFGSGIQAQPHTILKAYAKSGLFKFKTEATDPFYISMFSLGRFPFMSFKWHSISNYMVEPGDSIFIYFDDIKEQIRFSGKGSEKFEWRYKTRTFASVINKTNSTIEKRYNFLFSNLQKRLAYNVATLNSNKGNLSTYAYINLKADAYAPLYEVYNDIAQLKFGRVANLDSVVVNRVMKQYENTLRNFYVDTNKQAIQAQAKITALLMMEKAKAEYVYRQIKALSTPPNVFHLIYQMYPKGLLRDKAMMCHVYEQIPQLKLTEEMILYVRDHVDYIFYKQICQGLADTFGVGKLVRDFTFKDREGQTVTLEDYKGKAIFIDIWYTGCSACRDVAANMPEIEHQFKKNPNVAFISLSIDNNHEMWLKSLDPSNRINYYATPNTHYLITGKGRLHPFIQRYNPTGTYPKLLILDREGKIFDPKPPYPFDKKGQMKLVEILKKAIL
jgi:hypothetical protein